MFIDQTYVENEVKCLYDKKLSFLGYQVDQKEEQLRKVTLKVEEVKQRHAFVIKDVEEHKKIVEAMKAEQTKFLFGKNDDNKSTMPMDQEEHFAEMEHKNNEIKALKDLVDSLKSKLDVISQQNNYLQT